MAEYSKVIGQLGEDLASGFLDRLGWAKQGEWNQDLPCQHHDHKTAKTKSEKKIHGIDGVYGYTNPYSKMTDVLIIESKALSWMSGSTTKPESELAKQLNIFIEEISEKVTCAQRTKEFKEIYNLAAGWGQLKYVLVYYVHDLFVPALWKDIRKKIVQSASGSKVPIYIVNNEVMENALTALNFLEKQFAELGGIEKEFFFPELMKNPSSSFWQKYIPIDYLFSSFYLCRIKGKDKITHYILYSGTYSQESLRRLYAGLGRLQILSLDNLILVPLGLDKVADARHALTSISDDKNQIEVENRHVKITVKQPDKVVPSFKWNRE